MPSSHNGATPVSLQPVRSLCNPQVKDQLVRYATSALHFADMKVDPQLICWNRVVLLHGPPGTGKTSLCKALAQKLSIRFSDRRARDAPGRTGSCVRAADPTPCHPLFALLWAVHAGRVIWGLM